MISTAHPPASAPTQVPSQTVSGVHSGRPCPHVAEDGQRVRGLLESPRDRHLSSLKVMDHFCLEETSRRGCPEKSCDTKGQDTPSLGHAWPSLSIWPQFVSGTQG